MVGMPSGSAARPPQLPSDDAELAAAYRWEEPDGPLRVRANMVGSIDGRAALAGASAALGSPADQHLLAVLRATADVLLVGAGTVRAEGYDAIGSDDARRAALRPGAAPLRLAVVSGSGHVADLSALGTATAVPLVITSGAGERNLGDGRAEVITAGDDRLDLGAALAALAARGLHRVLCEGGPTLLGDLLLADLVDEFCLTVSPLHLGPTAPGLLGTHELTARRWALRSCYADGDHLFTRYADARAVTG
jgi:riboflavin biosynthesis pyrimidine reductase